MRISAPRSVLRLAEAVRYLTKSYKNIAKEGRCCVHNVGVAAVLLQHLRHLDLLLRDRSLVRVGAQHLLQCVRSPLRVFNKVDESKAALS